MSRWRFSASPVFNTAGGQVFAPRTFRDGKVVDRGNYLTKRTGYTFTGWYADASRTRRLSTLAITADTTVLAGWR